MTRSLRRVLALALASLLIGAMASAAPAQAAPGPPDAPEYWFDTWHINQLWHSGARGQGVTIAEVDTGVNASLPELKANVLPGKDFGVHGGIGHVDRETDAFGHGTAMASIMVGHPGLLGITGLAPDAKVLPVAVPVTGTTDAAPDDHLAQAIRWAVDHGGKVISMSLGGARDPATDAVPCPEAEQSAVYYALSKGAVVLAAAGNNGLTTNAVEEPGVCLGVVSVGAVDRMGSVAGFSSRHRYLTLAAPGVRIPSLSRVSGSAYSGNGTSQATAIASAVVALVWSKYPKLTGREVVTRVLATLDKHRTKRNSGYGFGLINAYRAVTGKVSRTAANPVYEAADPFLERDRALASPAVAGPQPAGSADPSLGNFSIGTAPRLLVPKVLGGIALAAAGLIALIALTVTASVRRRRLPDLAVMPLDVPLPVRDPLPPGREGAPLLWHDISAPPARPEPDPSTR
jgi:subtilisin family serine protease